MPSDFFWISYASRRRPQMSSLSTDPPPLVMIFRYCSSVGWTERSSVSGSRITMTSYLRMRELHLLWSRRPRDGPVAGGRMLEADPSVSRPRVAAPERTPESSVPGRNRARQFRPGAPEPAAIRDRRGLGVRSSALRQAQGTGPGQRTAEVQVLLDLENSAASDGSILVGSASASAFSVFGLDLSYISLARHSPNFFALSSGRPCSPKYLATPAATSSWVGVPLSPLSPWPGSSDSAGADSDSLGSGSAGADELGAAGDDAGASEVAGCSAVVSSDSPPPGAAGQADQGGDGDSGDLEQDGSAHRSCLLQVARSGSRRCGGHPVPLDPPDDRRTIRHHDGVGRRDPPTPRPSLSRPRGP